MGLALHWRPYALSIDLGEKQKRQGKDLFLNVKDMFEVQAYVYDNSSSN